MRRKTVLMRVDIEFKDLCRDFGIGTNATRQLVKEKTILSEMMRNDDFIKQIKDIYKEL